MTESLNDRAIAALASLRAIEVPTDHPMRHTVRTIRDAAQQDLANAFQHAERMAWVARDLIEQFDRHEAERDKPADAAPVDYCPSNLAGRTHKYVSDGVSQPSCTYCGKEPPK